MSNLEGRVAIVTGAARGIGLAAAAALAGSGARVLMSDIDEPELVFAAGAFSGKGLAVDAIRADVASRESVDAMVARAISAWGRIDILVNNAAISDDTTLATLTQARWDQVMAVNLDSVLHCVQAALAHLEKSPAASIVNIASTQGIRGQPNSIAYATAKGAVVNLTRCLAVDLGPLGICVNAVAPGYIDTRMAQLKEGGHEHQTREFQDVFIKYGRLPLRRPGMVDDLAGPIRFLAGDDSLYVTGQVLVVDGGFTCTY